MHCAPAQPAQRGGKMQNKESAKCNLECDGKQSGAYVKVRDRSGKLKKYIIEVKPKNQCTPPEKTPKRRTGKWFSRVRTWGINKAKWKSAEEFCKSHGMQFKILTEDHLNPR